jgi:hypothetical protein
MNNSQFSIMIIIITGILAVLQALSILIIQEILKKKIEFEFKKREQAAIVAELFAEWISDPKDKKKLNQLAWEATLWLPDPIAKEVNKRLANKEDAADIRKILIDIKKHIHGKKSDLDWTKLVFFE